MFFTKNDQKIIWLLNFKVVIENKSSLCCYTSLLVHWLLRNKSSTIIEQWLSPIKSDKKLSERKIDT